MFITGLLGFAIASAISDAAGSFVVLVTARALQGAFGAVLAPVALGGALTEYLSWRWCLYVNLVFAALVFGFSQALTAGWTDALTLDRARVYRDKWQIRRRRQSTQTGMPGHLTR